KGAEEYLDSEKYQIRQWDWDAPHSLAPLISRLNQVRRAHPALQDNRSLTFHDVEGDMLLCYSKRRGDDVILVVVNMDTKATRSGVVVLDLHALGLTDDAPFTVHDLLTDSRYVWHGARNYVELNPHVLPAHVLHV